MTGSECFPLSDGERAAITALLQLGKTLLAISTALGRATSTVVYAAMAMRAGAARARVYKRVRRKELTDCELRTLNRAMDNNGFFSMACLTEMVNTTRSQAAGGPKKGTVSIYTIRRAV